MTRQELSRTQENVIEQMSLDQGRVHVGQFDSKGAVFVTTPDGACHRVSQEGSVKSALVNFTIDWTYA